MKFKGVALLLIFSSSSSCTHTSIWQNKERASSNLKREFIGVKKKIALLTFANEAPYGGQDLGVIATEELRRELLKTGEFIVDPMASKIFGSSKRIFASGGIKLVQFTQKAKANGINLVIFGRIKEARIRQKTDEIGLIRETKSYTESKIEVRVFNINVGKESYVDTITGYADNRTYRFFMDDKESVLNERQELLRYGVKVAVKKAVPSIVKVSAQVDWTGRVAKIVGNKIYINAGRKSGIQINDILKVLTQGEDIFDPDTGAFIGASKGEIKGTVEVIDYFGPNGSIAILHSGGLVVEGDFVQLY